MSGTFYISYENSPGGVISELTSGQSGVGFYRTAVTGNWTQSGLVDFPIYVLPSRSTFVFRPTN